MACSDYKLTFFVDGVELPRPQRIYGCQGDTVRISATTTLPGQIEYKWSIDGPVPIVWVGNSYDYIFDDKSHSIRLDARSLDNPSCGIISDVKAKGQQCVECVPICNVQSVRIPAGDIVSLTDENGKAYPINNATTVCVDGSNKTASAHVKSGIKAYSKCNLTDLHVNIYHNREGRSCITLTISNSPIRFKYVTVGSTKFLFNTSKC